MVYKVAIKTTDEGVSACVPGLPGCWSEGADEGEAMENIRVAIQEYLQVADELLADQDVRRVEVVT